MQRIYGKSTWREALMLSGMRGGYWIFRLFKIDS
jgi:hypothetical protein